MAYDQRIRTISLPNSAARALAQFAFVNVDNTGSVQLAVSGAAALGVLQNPVLAAESAASVQPLDGSISKVQVGAVAVAAGANLMTDANGLAITATTGNAIVAVALEAGAAGQTIAAVVTYLGKA